MKPAATQQSSSAVVLRTVVACLIFAVFLQVLAARQLATTSVHADFRSFYTAASLLRTVPTDLYSFGAQVAFQDAHISPDHYSLPYYHLPYEALLFIPVSYLPYWTAYRCTLLLNSVLLWAVLLALPELQIDRYPLRRLPGLPVFLSLPVVIALVQGQDSVLVLLLCSLAWRAWKQDCPAVSGMLLGLALFRFQVVLPLVALLWWHARSSRLLLGFVGTATAVLALSWSLVGTAGLRSMGSMVRLGSLAHDHTAAVQDLVAVHPRAMPNLFGLLSRLGLTHLPGSMPLILAAAASVAVFLFTGVRVRRNGRRSEVFALALLCSVLVSFHLYLHDLALLPLTLALLRTRAALLLGAATYLLAAATLFLGANTFYLLAIPLLLMLLPDDVFCCFSHAYRGAK